MVSHYNMQIQISLPKKSEIMSTVNAPKRSKDCGIVLHADLFIATSAVSVELLLPFISNSEIFSSECKRVFSWRSRPILVFDLFTLKVILAIRRGLCWFRLHKGKKLTFSEFLKNLLLLMVCKKQSLNKIDSLYVCLSHRVYLKTVEVIIMKFDRNVQSMKAHEASRAIFWVQIPHAYGSGRHFFSENIVMWEIKWKASTNSQIEVK